MRRINPFLAVIAMLALAVPGLPSALEPVAPLVPKGPVRWSNKVIKISLSTSLTNLSTSIASGSDVIGAVQRALHNWSMVSGIRFEVAKSRVQSISPAGAGDGINLITVAPTAENLAIFGGGHDAARTRIHYDQFSGEITEADIAINPYPRSAEGTSLLFSTDGTRGTYDLESTFAHEIGHVLGLEHSLVIASTMQESQGLNGTFGLPAFTERTLSESDRVAVRSLYGPCENMGAVSGKVLNNVQGRMVPASGARLWIEDAESGRVMAGTVVSTGGRFSVGCLPVGEYKAIVENQNGPMTDAPVASAAREGRAGARLKSLRATEISSFLRISADEESPLNFVLVPTQIKTRILRPRVFGINGDLSTVPVSADAGAKLKLFVGGIGVDQVAASGLFMSSPFVTINPESIVLQSSEGSIPLISFEVIIAADAPPGDYSLRLQSNSGELAYLVGAISVNAPPSQ